MKRGCLPDRYIFFEPPLSVRWDKFGGYLLGQNEQTQMVKFDNSRPGKWMLIPRGREGEPLIIETPPQFIWHYASASEDPVTGEKSQHVTSLRISGASHVA